MFDPDDGSIGRPSLPGGAYRTLAVAEEDMRLISNIEYRSRDNAHDGWTVMTIISFTLTTLFASLQAYFMSMFTFAVLSLGCFIVAAFSFSKKREHVAIIKQYWNQPNIDKDDK